MSNLNFWIVTSFLYPILFAINNIINSILVNKNFSNPYVLTFYKSITNFIFAPILLIIYTPTIPSYSLIFMYFILGLLDLLYLIPYYKALKNIDTSIVTALFALGRIIIPILGYIFLDEKLRNIQYFGFFIIITSSILLSSQTIKSLKINKAFCLMVLSSLIHSIFLVLEKYTINKDVTWINMMIYPLIFSSIIPFILFFSSNTKAEIYKTFSNFKKNISLFLTMELFSFIGLLTITFILPHIPSTTKTSISSSTPIFVLIFGLLLKTYKKADYIENISKLELRKKLFLFLLISYGTFLVIKP